MPVYVCIDHSNSIFYTTEEPHHDSMYIALTKKNHRAFLLCANYVQVCINSRAVDANLRTHKLKHGDILVLLAANGRTYTLEIILLTWTHLAYDEQDKEWEFRADSCFKVKKLQSWNA